MRIRFIRTYYPHWSEFSGYHRFIRFLPSDWEVSECRAPIYREAEAPAWMRRLRARFGGSWPAGYDVYDFLVEIEAYRDWIANGVDVVHYLDGEHGPLYLPHWMAGRASRGPAAIVVTYHQPPGVLEHYLRPQLHSRVDRSIVLCRDQLSFLEQRINSGAVSLVPHGVDVDHFTPGTEARYGAADGKTHLVTVGSWLRDRDALMATARLLPDDRFRLHLLSQDPDAESTPCIHHHARLSDTQLLELYQKCDALLLPLIDATANNVILEAMACGLAVISSRLAAVEEYVSPHCARLAANNEPETFAKILLHLSEHRDLLRELGMAARERAEQLSWAKQSRKLIDVLMAAREAPRVANRFKYTGALPSPPRRAQKTIAMFSTYTRGGAGRAAMRLLRGLRDSDQNVVMFTTQVVGHAPHLFEIKPAESSRDAQLEVAYVANNRSEVSNTLFSVNHYDPVEFDLNEVKRADIINLHWVAHMLSPASIRQLAELGKPIVWTLHDQRPFTGGCHYAAGCRGFVNGCGSCPQLLDDWAHLPAAALGVMRATLEQVPLTVVAPSRWLAREARRSLLFRDKEVVTIANGIDPALFFPEDKMQARHRLGLTRPGLVFQFSAETTLERRKGLKELIAALEICCRDRDFKRQCETEAITLLGVGKPCPALEAVPIAKQVLGYIHDDQQLRGIYSASDLFILPSLEDNLPNTLLESMACGTPVLAFDTGGARDVIGPDNGLLVPTGDVRALAQAILMFARDTEWRRNVSSRCRETIENGFTVKHQAAIYLELFTELLERPSRPSAARSVRLTPEQENAAFDQVLRRANQVPDQEFISFTAGWHEHEQDGTGWWRWSVGRGTITIEGPRNEIFSLSLSLRSIFPVDTIAIHFNGCLIGKFLIGSSRQLAVTTPLACHQGSNQLTFVSARGACANLENEIRCLSFMLRNLSLRRQPDAVSGLEPNADILPLVGTDRHRRSGPCLWRCICSDGAAIIEVQSPRRCCSRFHATFPRFHTMTQLRVSINGRELTRVDLSPEQASLGPIDLNLEPGMNVVSISADIMHPGGKRTMGRGPIVVENIRLEPLPQGRPGRCDRYQLWRRSRLLRRSGLFFAAFYRGQVAHLGTGYVAAASHYLLMGAWQGLNPNPLFDSSWYLAHYPDVHLGAENPLLHYCLHGWLEGRDPHPDFSTEAYLNAHPDVRASGMNPLTHYLRHGIYEARHIQPSTDHHLE